MKPEKRKPRADDDEYWPGVVWLGVGSASVLGGDEARDVLIVVERGREREQPVPSVSVRRPLGFRRPE